MSDLDTIGYAPLIEPETLTRVLRRAHGSATLTPGPWQMEAIRSGRGAASGGVYRVAGTGREAGRAVPWTVIVKVLTAAGSGGGGPASRDPAHPLYWRREALAYESGLLDDLPGGLRAPRCFAVQEQPGEVVWLWLEEVRDALSAPWRLADYAQAAGTLGRFNGAYLAGRPPPGHAWLVRPGSLRGLLHAVAGVRALAADPATWAHPRLRGLFPPGMAGRLARLWDERGPLLDGLDRLPVTFCHHDAWRGNCFALPGGDGARTLVLIDWAYPGYGALGTDAGDLLGASAMLAELAAVPPAALDAAVFGPYLAGLRSAGWAGDARAARFGAIVHAGLKYAGLLLWLPAVLGLAPAAPWEEQSGLPFPAFLARQATLVPYLLDRLDEARGLLPYL